MTNTGMEYPVDACPHARAWLEVDLDALIANYREAKSLLKPGVEMICVLKANAYGYGAVPVSKALYAEGVRAFAVATVPEGLTLKNSLPGDVRILCMGEPAQEEFDACIRAGLRITMGGAEPLKALSRAAAATGLPAYVHLKLDTGLHRLGFTDVEALTRMGPLDGLVYEGVFSHLALRGEAQSVRQHTLFVEMTARLREAGYRFSQAHLLDSIGLTRYPDWQHDAVRVGAFLYGNVPPAYAHFDRRRAVGRFCARVTRVATVPAGEGVGYDNVPLPRDTRVATLAAGYVDGYARSLSGVGEVELHGRRARVLGLVCMDQMMVDVSDIPEAKTGDTAVLLGGGITINELAERGRLNRNEVTACIGPRVPRIYLNGREGYCAE